MMAFLESNVLNETAFTKIIYTHNIKVRKLGKYFPCKQDVSKLGMIL